MKRAGQLFRFFAGETVRNAGELLGSVRPGHVAGAQVPVEPGRKVAP